jgi:hypothetical protein
MIASGMHQPYFGKIRWSFKTSTYPFANVRAVWKYFMKMGQNGSGLKSFYSIKHLSKFKWAL